MNDAPRPELGWVSLGKAAIAAVNACARAFQTDGADTPTDAATLPHDDEVPESP